MTHSITIGFVPLTDAAPLIVAHEMGFAKEEGLDVNLLREQSWASIRDKLSYGIIDAAHLLLPMAIGMSLGVAPVKTQIDFPLVLSMNGNGFVASAKLAVALKAIGSRIGDAQSFGRAMIKLSHSQPIPVAVPFLQSMHVTMLRHLITQMGGRPEDVFDFRVASPSKIEQLLTDGDVDGFMVGAPWASSAVENSAGQLMLTSNTIWQGAPDKVLGLRHDWVQENTEAAIRLTRAIYRAANWASEHSNSAVVSEILSRPCYLDLAANLIENNLCGETIVNQSGQQIIDPLAQRLDARCIGFPWQSAAAFIAQKNAAYWDIDPKCARHMASKICRPDIYRQALESVGAPLPSANQKVEGSLHFETEVPGLNNPVLGPDAFFNGKTFDPA